jgi:hypothetical protein
VDDGVLTALLMGPYAAVSMLYGSLTTPNLPLRPPSWLVEAPATLPQSALKMPVREALLSARRNLVQLTTLCSFVLLVHLFTSKQVDLSRIKAGSWLPKKRGRRSWFFVGYSLLISAAAVTFHIASDMLSLNIWKGMLSYGEDKPTLTLLDLTYFDVLVISSFYQFCIYVMARLSHGGFTLGELGLVAHGATALFMETTNLTIALVRTLSMKGNPSPHQLSDLASDDAIHKDLPLAHAASDLPARPYPRVSPHRIPPLTPSRVVPTYLPTAHASTQTASRTRSNEAPARSWLLRVRCPYHSRFDWDLGDVLSREAKPLDLGVLLAGQGKDTIFATDPTGILGPAGSDCRGDVGEVPRPPEEDAAAEPQCCS